MLKILDFIIYWTMLFLPFSIAISNAPMNVFMGLLIFAFLLKKIAKGESLFEPTAVNILLLVLFILTCLSALHSVSMRDTIKGGMLRLLQYIFILFIVAQELKDRRHLKGALIFMGLGALLSSFDAIWQVWQGKDFIRGYAPVFNLDLVRATASFKDSNVLGVYLSAIAPVIFGFALYWSRKWARAGLILCGLLVIAAIALTYSRPTLLAIYAALLLLGIALRDRRLIIGLVIITLASPLLIPKSVKDWMREVGYHPLRIMCNDDRIAVYRNTLNMIKDHPVIGLGANTYMKNYKNYREAVEYRNIVTKDFMYAHNIYLHMAAEIGLLGLAVFIWLLYKLFLEAAGIFRFAQDGYFKIAAISLAAALLAFLVNGLTESSLYYSRVAVIFWYLCGLLLSLKRIAKPASTR